MSPPRAICGKPHPEYGNLAVCDLDPGHDGDHHANVNLPATGGWVGDQTWNEAGDVDYEGRPG